MKPSSWLEMVKKNPTQLLIFLYQGLAVLAYVVFLIQALGFFNTPFLGVFIEHTMMTNGVGKQGDPSWGLFNAGLNEYGNQLLSLAVVLPDNSLDAVTPVHSYKEIQTWLKAHESAATIRATFQMMDGQEKTFDTSLSSFNWTSQFEYFVIPYVIGLVYLSIGLWIFGLRRTETAGRAFSILSAAVALVVGGLLDLYTTHSLTALWVFSVPMVGGALFHLGLVFPQEARIMLRYPFLRWAVYIPSLLLGSLNLTTIFRFDAPRFYASIWQYSYVFTGLGILFFIASTFYRRYQSPSPVARQQARTILVGALVGFLPITSWLFLSSPLVSMVLGNPFSFTNFNPIFFFVWLIVFPATTGYTVLRYRLLRTDYLLGRGVLYFLLSILAIGGYVLLSVSLSLLTGAMMTPGNPIVISLAVFLWVLLLNPVRTRLQEMIDSIFFRGEKAHQERLKIFTREMTNVVDIGDVLKTLREQISMSLLPSQLHIFIFDPMSGYFISTPDESGRPTTDVHFSSNSPLPATLGRDKLPIYIDELRLPSSIQAERGRLAILNVQLFIPLPGRDRLVGWVALGERLSGENYASHDISFLEDLCSQSAVALERAQVVKNMERRVHEMNVLARVAQGINITLNFDDILELIYAQSTQIIPGSDFHLTLYNKVARNFYYAFCLENDERFLNKENMPLPTKSTLEQEVITTRRAILTQDFVSQCQALGINPAAKNIYAWLGVPLNTGAETIGALSIASHDASVAYTEGQLDLFQSIADQAAGAIIKSRLLQETEHRAQQLDILNQVARQLASTLELQPLLKSILESAVNLLSAEAGSLFLVDSQTDELIFQVTVGPVAQNLVGQRLPPGTGVVGKAVTSRQPVNHSDVASSSTWNSVTDKQTGFITKAILAVPMEVKDKVIGVIEIINKKDGLPFTNDDETLISAFGGQAAVAIENARLYTLTDQELNARVEELSVMQRIDRELNASLEVERAMRITLEWAMRQSKAEAGLIGFAQEKGLYLVASQGYSGELEAYKDEYMPTSHPGLKSALESGAPHRTSTTEGEVHGFLKSTRSQLSIPIRREAHVIGLVLLESTNAERFQQDELNFLNRLADHAAIAIANAQLYAEVQQASVAKSEFVSLVAHELKNPMTSIKGYAELLAAGAVGPITEMQTNFLTTIRSNIERMKTIVEDLNDNSKIEAGRLRLDFKAIEVPDIVEEVVRSTKRQIDDKKQSIEIVVPEGLPKVWADKTRISQILVNLVSNAHKYTQEGGHIIVQAEKSANNWDPDGAKEVVHVWVKDNGIGISPEDQRKIFGKFFRSEDEQARKSPGTGLGLNITRSLVEMQGGKIWFESEFRKGTIFHITVPISEN